MAATLKARDLVVGDHVRPIGETLYRGSGLPSSEDWGDGSFRVVRVDAKGLVITVDSISKRVAQTIEQRLNFTPQYEDGPLDYYAYDPGSSLRGSRITLFERVPDPRSRLSRITRRK
jgi:hypothetical protein